MNENGPAKPVPPAALDLPFRRVVVCELAMTGFDEAVQAAADQIERYLEAHPAAADTAEGIATWWLSGVSEPIVQVALDELVRRGVVKRETVTGGQPQYSRARGR